MMYVLMVYDDDYAYYGCYGCILWFMVYVDYVFMIDYGKWINEMLRLINIYYGRINVNGNGIYS